MREGRQIIYIMCAKEKLLHTVFLATHLPKGIYFMMMLSYLQEQCPVLCGSAQCRVCRES